MINKCDVRNIFIIIWKYFIHYNFKTFLSEQSCRRLLSLFELCDRKSFSALKKKPEHLVYTASLVLGTVMIIYEGGRVEARVITGA